MKPPALPMIVQLLFTFLLAWLVGLMVAHSAWATTVLMTLAIMLSLACAGRWGQKSRYAIVVEVSFITVMVVIMMACQVLL